MQKTPASKYGIGLSGSFTLMILVLVHVVGVLWSSRTHGENLLKAMLTGRKQAPPEAGIHRNWGLLGLALLLGVLWFVYSQLRA